MNLRPGAIYKPCLHCGTLVECAIRAVRVTCPECRARTAHANYLRRERERTHRERLGEYMQLSGQAVISAPRDTPGHARSCEACQGCERCIWLVNHGLPVLCEKPDRRDYERARAVGIDLEGELRLC